MREGRHALVERSFGAFPPKPIRRTLGGTTCLTLVIVIVLIIAIVKVIVIVIK